MSVSNGNENDNSTKQFFDEEEPQTPIDDNMQAKARKKTLSDQHTNRMVFVKRRVPEMQSSSVLLTLAVGLLWRLETTRIDHPSLYLSLQRLRIPVAFARRNPLSSKTFEKVAPGGDGEWSGDSATVYLRFSNDTVRSSVPALASPGFVAAALPPEIAANSFEVRYLNLLEIINLATSSISRSSISPNECHFGDGVFPSVSAFESAPDRGGNEPDKWRECAAETAASGWFQTLDFRECEQIEHVLRDIYVQKINELNKHRNASSTADAEAGGDVREGGSRTVEKNMYADPRVRVYATLVDGSRFEEGVEEGIDGGGIAEVLAQSNQSMPSDANGGADSRLFDDRVRFHLTYLQMNTFDECTWTTASNDDVLEGGAPENGGKGGSSNDATVPVGKFFKREYDSDVETALRHGNKKKQGAAAASSAGSNAKPTTTTSAAWRDQWAKYIADIVARFVSDDDVDVMTGRPKQRLETKEDLEQLFTSPDALMHFRRLMIRRRKALTEVPNYRAVAFHLLDAVDALLVDVTEGEYPAQFGSVSEADCEQTSHLNRLFQRYWRGEHYTNHRLLAYPLHASNSGYGEYEYDFERHPPYSSAAERVRAEAEADATVAKEYAGAEDDVRDAAFKAYLAQQFHCNSMFEPHYAARRFYRHFLNSLTENNGECTAFAPLLPTDPSSAGSLQFTRLFAKHCLPLQAHCPDTAHVDFFDDAAIERMLDSGFLLTFLADPIASVDSSANNEYRTLYAPAVRPEMNPFRRFAAQIEFYLFGDASDRAAVEQQYPSVVDYVDRYIVPRFRETPLFRLGRKAALKRGCPYDTLAALVRSRILQYRQGNIDAEREAQEKLKQQGQEEEQLFDDSGRVYPRHTVHQVCEALGKATTWRAFEPALQFYFREADWASFNWRVKQHHLQTSGSTVTAGELREMMLHAPLDEWHAAASFVRTIIACSAPFSRDPDNKSMPFSLLYDYGLYCIDRRLQRRVPLMLARFSTAAKNNGGNASDIDEDDHDDDDAAADCVIGDSASSGRRRSVRQPRKRNPSAAALGRVSSTMRGIANQTSGSAAAAPAKKRRSIKTPIHIRHY